MLRRFLFLTVIWVLASVFSTSCKDECVCGPPGTFRITTQGLDLKAYQTQGFGIKPVIDSAFSIAFGIQIDFKQLSERIALKANTGSDFFGNAAYACSCIGPSYEVPDPVNEINLYLINPLQGDTTLVSDKFRTNIFYGQEPITLDSAVFYMNAFKGNYYTPAFFGFTLELVEPSLFSGSRQIQCVTKLKSGKVFTASTQNIYFK
jgi:hypothetical protein